MVAIGGFLLFALSGLVAMFGAGFLVGFVMAHVVTAIKIQASEGEGGHGW